MDRERKKENKELRKQLEIDHLINTMKHASGRAVVWGILTDCKIYQAYTGDAGSVLFCEGKRAAGLRLMLQIMQYCPMQFWLMQVENCPNYDWASAFPAFKKEAERIINR